MRVFGAKRIGGYSGGVILVAANTIEEAILTASKDAKYEWMFEWYDDDYNFHEGDLRYMTSEYYPIENWSEIKDLTWNGNEPTVIIEDGYSE